MATLTPSLTLTANANTASSAPGLQSDAISFTVTDTLTVTAPSNGITRVSTAANALGAGAGILLTEAASTATTFVYIKHLGLLASDGTTECHASNDYITLSNEDADVSFIKLQPGEFAFFPLLEFDGSDGGVEPGGLKVTAGSAAVMVEYGCWTRG